MSSTVEKEEVTEKELKDYKDAKDDLPDWKPLRSDTGGPADYAKTNPSLKDLLKEKKDFLHWELCLLKQDKDSFVETTLTGVQAMVERTTKKIEDLEKTMKNTIRLYGILKKKIPGLKFSKASLERKFVTLPRSELEDVEAKVDKMVKCLE